jgi:hypothetical protein
MSFLASLLTGAILGFGWLAGWLAGWLVGWLVSIAFFLHSIALGVGHEYIFNLDLFDIVIMLF